MKSVASVAEFRAALRQEHQHIVRVLDGFVQEVAITVATNITEGGRYAPGTPIDTGWARNSWYSGFPALGAPPLAESNPDRKTPPRNALAEAVLAIRASFHPGGQWRFGSNVVYMPRLEYEAWSAQAPRGFVRLTYAARDQIVAGAAKHALTALRQRT